MIEMLYGLKPMWRVEESACESIFRSSPIYHKKKIITVMIMTITKNNIHIIIIMIMIIIISV